MQYTERRRRRGERREKLEGSRAGNKSKGQKNHLTTTSWAKLKEGDREREENERETSQNSQHFYNDTIKGVKERTRMEGGGLRVMAVALQLADRCERGYELNTRTLNNSRSTYSTHFGQRGSQRRREEVP